MKRQTGELKKSVLGKSFAGLYILFIILLTITTPLSKGYSVFILAAITVPWNIISGIFFEKILGEYSFLCGVLSGAIINTFLLFGIGYIIERSIKLLFK